MVTTGWGSLPEGVAADVRRVADRLRGLSAARLAAPVPPLTSRAAATRAVAQQLAEAAQGLSQRADPDEPRWRVLPVVSNFAVGDQLAVVGQDLADEVARCGPDADVWVRGARRTALEVVTAAADSLAATRRLL